MGDFREQTRRANSIWRDIALSVRMGGCEAGSGSEGWWGVQLGESKSTWGIPMVRTMTSASIGFGDDLR